jgi:hypothetical protein
MILRVDRVQRRGRSMAGAVQASVKLCGDDEELDWLRIKARKSIREMRACKGKRGGPKSGGG